MTVNKKTEKINNEIKEQAALSFNVVGGTGKVTNFTPGNNGTVQPVALLRLGVFVPAPPGVAKKNLPEGLVTMDVSRDLQHMQIASSEGYKEISLSSPRLDMGTDFRVWLGIVRSLHDHGHYSGRIKLPFSTFLKNCGFDPSRSNKPMKQRIDASMIKLKMVTFQFRNEDSTLTTGLINWARYNIKTNEIEIEGDPRIQELYQIDYKVYLRLKALDNLQRKESAQALYTYLASLPKDPAPISMKRFRDRLRLTSPVASQNMIIRRSLKELEQIGYLQYREEKIGRSIKFHILKRSPSLDAKKTILVPAAHNPADDDALIHKLKMLKAAGYSETEIAGVLDALDKLQREGKPESEVEDADFEEL